MYLFDLRLFGGFKWDLAGCLAGWLAGWAGWLAGWLAAGWLLAADWAGWVGWTGSLAGWLLVGWAGWLLAGCWLGWLAGLAGLNGLAGLARPSYFMDFEGRGLETCRGIWHRGPAPIETFARS